jgi:NADPH:quinone reductase-like Zn-dependent oxidoreductase
VGANAYWLTNDRAIWRKYREILDHLSRHVDSGALAPPQITILGLSSEVVKRAHALLENNAVQGKLIMAC